MDTLTLLALTGRLKAVAAVVVTDTAVDSSIAEAARTDCCKTTDRSAADRTGSVTAELAADDGCSRETPLSRTGIGSSIISLIVLLGYRREATREVELIPGKWTGWIDDGQEKSGRWVLIAQEAIVRCQFTNPAYGKMVFLVEAPTNRLPNVLSWDGE